MESPQSFAQKLLGWYAQHQRDLPWRHTRDPYKIWLSEIILQQTRVQQGLPYYQRFVERFPTVADLAAAEEQEVLRLWQGLGYYSRARNLHAAAKTVVSEHGGRFPDTYKELLKLKGVGSYTAAAIASFAFGEAVGVLDGNVFRVLARVYGVEIDIASPKGKREFFELAQSLVSPERPGEYNQAIMEFGATHCKPASPDCMFCVFAQTCEARRTGRVNALPVKSKKTKVKIQHFHYLVFRHEGRLLMKARMDAGIWQGLYDFPLVESQAPLEWEALASKLPENARSLAPSEVSQEYTHLLSHRKLLVRFYILDVDSEKAFARLAEWGELRSFGASQIASLPKPALIVRFLEERENLLT